LKKDYKIIKSVTATYGKWPMTYGNAFFTDSRYLIDDIIEMIQSNIITVLQRHNMGKDDQDYVEQMLDLLRYSLKPNFID